MQKTPLSQILREELTRAFVFGIGFFAVLSIGFVSVAYAANGGKFGEMLNLILTGNKNGVSGRTWETTTDGTVYNAKLLNNKSDTDFVKLSTVRSCPIANQCIYGFDNSTGDPLCH